MPEETNYQEEQPIDFNLKIRDLEERQRILKDRMILISHNLIELKEKTNEEAIKTKKRLGNLEQEIEKIKSFLENISREFSKFARKDELNILSKQLKLFEPLKYLKEKE